MKINDTKNLLKEGKVDEALSNLLEELDSQTAAGPELGVGAELKDEATKPEAPEAKPEVIASTDVYPTDEHKEVEEVKPVEIKEEESQVAAGPELGVGAELKDEATKPEAPVAAEPTVASTDVYPTDEHKEAEEVKPVEVTENTDTSVVEDSLDSNPAVAAAVDTGVAAPVVAPVGKIDDVAAQVAAEPVVADASVDASSDSDESDADISVEVDNLIDNSSDEDDDGDFDYEDLAEGKGFSKLFKLVTSINESIEAADSQVAAGPELGTGAELKDEATKSEAPEAKPEVIASTDVYPTDEHKETEEVKPVEVAEAVSREKEPSAKELKHIEKVGAEKYAKEGAEKIPTKQLKEEESQVAAGPELGAGAELKDEATKPETPVAAAPAVASTDVYPTDEHKQLEDVIDVVIEACKRCKSAGKKLIKENIVSEAKLVLKEEDIAPAVGDPAKKEYDSDADIESAEMNGSDTAFPCYDKIQGDGADAAKPEDAPKPSDIVVSDSGAELKESVGYKSIKEACMLDEGYFQSNTYTVQTADEKKARLREQVSLLLAREAMDPTYDELLKTSVYAQRLEESLINKYGNIAESRVKAITK